MKLIFRNDGTLWVIDRAEREPDVDGCTSVIAPAGYDPVTQTQIINDDIDVSYKTLDTVMAELGTG